MALTFNSILRDVDIEFEDVRLIRHKDNRATRGHAPYDLWRDNRPQFELYQSTQAIKNRAKLNAKYWAVFLGTPGDETLFIGLYCVKYRGLLEEDHPMPHLPGQVDKAGSCDFYDLTLGQTLSDLVGRLLVDWGPGALAWVQYAHKNNKPVVEVRKEFKEPEFPGFLNFIKPLSEIETLPNNWKPALKSCKGIYLLTCPRTREQYVGSATGAECFWQRWQDYVHTGHGGNVSLKSRDPSDYQVAILEVAGSASTDEEILNSEQRWMKKLQSKEMGLNR